MIQALVSGIFVFCVVFFSIKLYKANAVYLQKYRRRLLSKEWTIRRDTVADLAREIKNYGRFTPRMIVPLILKALNDRDWHVRSLALSTLSQKLDQTVLMMGTKSFQTVLSRSEKRELIERCRRLLCDDQGSIRLEALEILTRSRDIQAFSGIVKLVGDESEPIRRAANRALKGLCPLVKAVVFTRNRAAFPPPSPKTLWNPDLSSLTIPMSQLCHIILDLSTSDPRIIDQCAQYMDIVLDDAHLRSHVSLAVFGDPFCCSPATHQIWSHCKHVEFDIPHLVFGTKTPPHLPPQQTLKNPDFSTFPLPLSLLQTVFLDTSTYDFHQVERFLTYAVNYIGPKHLKKHVDIHIYGNPEQLDQNLRNNFMNLCKQVHVHQKDVSG